MRLLLILYNLLFAVLYVPAAVAGLLFIKDRRRYRQRLGFGLPPRINKPSFWLHAASVGEVRSLSEFVAELRTKYPQYGIVLSTFTETGYDVASSELKPDVQFVLPLENFIVFRCIIRRYNVNMVFVTDTELWPNMIYAVSGKAPMILLNGRISNKTYNSYKRFSFIFGRMCAKFARIFAKSPEDAGRFESLTGHPVDIGGNSKYSVHSFSPVKIELQKFAGKKIALAASTHSPEERVFAECAVQFKDEYDMVIIAPRHIKRANEIKGIVEAAGLTAGFYSENDFDKDILIVDAFGLMESLYQLAGRIFIGGSLADVGGHNVYEALKYSRQVCTGPNVYNFNDIIPLAASEGVVKIIHDKDELLTYFKFPIDTIDFNRFFSALDKQQGEYRDKIGYSIERLLANKG